MGEDRGPEGLKRPWTALLPAPVRMGQHRGILYLAPHAKRLESLRGLPPEEGPVNWRLRMEQHQVLSLTSQSNGQHPLVLWP